MVITIEGATHMAKEISTTELPNNAVGTPAVLDVAADPMGDDSDFVPANNRRRRLLQGVAGLAPFVLTLRSGAAAAAISGCAPMIGGTSVTTASNAKIPSTITGEKDGDYCLNTKLNLQDQLYDCGTSRSGTRDVKPIIPGSTLKTRVVKSGSYYYCGDDTTGKPKFKNVSVVIVSAGTSIIF
jgi:hypothetical protein